ncbi:hypothetical protein ACP4OV_012645 [Aristida adscensionis]
MDPRNEDKQEYFIHEMIHGGMEPPALEADREAEDDGSQYLNIGEDAERGDDPLDEDEPYDAPETSGSRNPKCKRGNK